MSLPLSASGSLDNDEASLSQHLSSSILEPSYDDIFGQDSFISEMSAPSLLSVSLETETASEPAQKASSSLVTPHAHVEPAILAGGQPRGRREATARSLPNIMVTNHRSIFPKFNSLIDELIECEMHLGLHSEIWESKENLDHKNKIEEALELHGILYISNPRPKRRGGGAAILTN